MTPKLLNDNELIFVDDDEVELELAQRFYAKSKLKNPLLTFRSGADFLAYLQPDSGELPPIPALVLMDVRMPRQNGFEVVAAVRRLERYSDVPIITMFSNSDDDSDMAKAKEVGADHYLVKPSTGKEYVAFLDSLSK